jgi:hypothetical protein
MGKKVLAAAVVTLIALLLTTPAGATSGTGAPASGAATAINTILSVDLGGLTAKLGVDRADSLLSSSPYASAGLDVLQSDIQSIQGAARDSRNGDASGASAIGAGTKTLPGIGAVTVTTGKVSTFMAPEKVSSSIVFDVASADLGPDLAHVGSVTTTTGTTVGTSSASVSRSIEIGAASLGSLGSLLDRLGVDPLLLGCSGLESAGAEFGVDTAQGCEVLAQIQADMGDTQSALDAAKTLLDTDLAAATATIAGLTLINPGLVALAAKYGQDIVGGILNPLSSAQRQALIDEIQSRIDDVSAGIADAAGETCATVLDAIDEVSTNVPDLATGLDAVETSLINGCAALGALLDDLLDVTVLSVDGIDISLTTLAKETSPAATALGQIGAIKVGNVVSVGIPLELGADAVQTATQTVRNDLGDALTALGLGAFPAPSIEILDAEVSQGKRADGTWFAKASVTTLHIGLPSTTLEGPATNNLGVLVPSVTGARPSRSLAARNRPGRMAPVTSPALSVDLASFSGSSSFRPATVSSPRTPNPNPNTNPAPGENPATDGSDMLPITGMPVPALSVGGALLLGAAAGIRRFLVQH